jgi:hypothetical protein
MVRVGWLWVAIAATAAGCISGCKSESGKEGDAKSAVAKSAAAPASPSGGTATTAAVAQADVKAADEACGEYEKTLEACIDKAPGPMKAEYESTLKKHREAWSAGTPSHKAQMADGCRTGVASLKQHPVCQ